MNRTKKYLKICVSFALALVLLISVFPSSAFAAGNACSNAKGSSAKTVTLQVTTAGKKATINLKQTKGTMKIYVLKFPTGDYVTNKKMYEYYKITLYKLVKGRYVQQGKPIDWSGTETKKIPLDKNATYRIRIAPYAVLYKSDFKFGPAFNPYPYGVFKLKIWAPKGWVTNCNWNVPSCKNIKTCVIV